MKLAINRFRSHPNEARRTKGGLWATILLLGYSFAFLTSSAVADVTFQYAYYGQSPAGTASLTNIDGIQNFSLTIAAPDPTLLSASQYAFLSLDVSNDSSPITVQALSNLPSPTTVTFNTSAEFLFTSDNDQFDLSPLSYFTEPFTETVNPGLNTYANLSGPILGQSGGGGAADFAFSSPTFGTPLFSSLPTNLQTIHFALTPYYGIGNTTPTPGVFYNASGAADLTVNATWNYETITLVNTSAAPEPSTWALMLAGLILLAIWRGHPRRMPSFADVQK